MKDLILIAIASAWFTDMSNLPQQLKWWLLKKKLWYKKQRGVFLERRIKPFDCEKCLSFWLSIIYTTSNNYQWYEVLIYSASTSALALFIIKLYKHDFSKPLQRTI